MYVIRGMHSNRRPELAFWITRIHPKWEILLHIYIWGNSTWTAHITEMWSMRSTRILSIGSPISSCTLIMNCMKLTPVNCHTVTSTKPLVLFVHLQRESLRPDMCSSPWNQDQQHEHDLPGSWLSWSFSLHSHTPFPSHLSWSLITSCVVVFDLWGFKYIDLI